MKHIIAATPELELALRRWQLDPTRELSDELREMLAEAGLVTLSLPEGVEVDVRPRPFISCGFGKQGGPDVTH